MAVYNIFYGCVNSKSEGLHPMREKEWFDGNDLANGHLSLILNVLYKKEKKSHHSSSYRYRVADFECLITRNISKESSFFV